jgi:hypothetical protein
MKRARRYAANFLFIFLYLALVPLAMVHAALEWVLEVIANDD